jgi:Na+-transporting NADH:ubiquinone oxidoreductase subunit NqrF
VSLAQRLGLVQGPVFVKTASGKMSVTNKSVFSGDMRTLEMDITEEQVAAWRGGTLIQKAFPTLSADEREFLLTGAWDDEWDEYVKPED